MSLVNLFVDVDDFCQTLTAQQPQLLLGHAHRPGRKPSLAVSEVMTIIIYFICLVMRERKPEA